MSFSFVRNSVNPQTVDETLHVATYELGKIIECHHYEKRFGPDRVVAKGYQDHGKTEMADLISMLRMYCEQKDWNFFVLYELGESRYVERMKDLIKEGKQEQLKMEFRSK